MPGKNRIQLNGFGRIGRIQEQVLAAGLDSLNVREMADVPEIDIDKMEDKEVTERFRREWKTAQYADLKGRRFRPTFSSNIDFFEIRGYDAERDMVLTTAHPKGGSSFDDEIEERYLAGPSRRATTWRCRWWLSRARPSMCCTTTTCLRPPAPCANRSSVAPRAPAATTASARRATPRGARPTGSNPAAIGLSWRNNNY